ARTDPFMICVSWTSRECSAGKQVKYSRGGRGPRGTAPLTTPRGRPIIRRQAMAEATMLPLWWVLPFVAMLLVIAVAPLWAPHAWEPNRNKLLVSGLLGSPVAVFYLGRDRPTLLGMAEDYVSFIVLLAGLYVIAGGIRLTGDLEATPLVNTTFL